MQMTDVLILPAPSPHGQDECTLSMGVVAASNGSAQSQVWSSAAHHGRRDETRPSKLFGTERVHHHRQGKCFVSTATDGDAVRVNGTRERQAIDEREWVSLFFETRYAEEAGLGWFCWLCGLYGLCGLCWRASGLAAGVRPNPPNGSLQRRAAPSDSLIPAAHLPSGLVALASSPIAHRSLSWTLGRVSRSPPRPTVETLTICTCHLPKPANPPSHHSTLLSAPRSLPSRPRPAIHAPVSCVVIIVPAVAVRSRYRSCDKSPSSLVRSQRPGKQASPFLSPAFPFFHSTT